MDKGSLTARVERYALAHGLLCEGMGIVVACSGGPDSLALAEVLLDLREKYRLRLCLAHFEHGIRGAASRADARYVADYAARRGLACRQGAGDVPQYAKKEGLSLETAARKLRYRFLRRVCREEGMATIAVAHHADDQAETVLMRLLRGAGPDGLAAMRPRRRDVIRPLLAERKADLQAFCLGRGLSPRHDATNDVPDGTRNRLRLELLPQLRREYNPALPEGLCQLAALAADWQDYMEREAERLWPRLVRQGRAGRELSAALSREHPALQQAVLRRFLRETAAGARDVAHCHVAAVLRLLASGGTGARLALPHGWQSVLSYGWLRLERQGRGEEVPFSLRLPVPGSCENPAAGWRMTARLLPCPPAATTAREYYCSFDGMEPMLVVRSRLPGDRMALSGGTRKVKEIFIDAKIPREARSGIPLAIGGGQVLWAAGVRRSSCRPVTERTKQVLLLKIEEIERKEEFCHDER